MEVQQNRRTTFFCEGHEYSPQKVLVFFVTKPYRKSYGKFLTHIKKCSTQFMIVGLVLLAWANNLQQKIPFVFAEKISYIKINVTPINDKTVFQPAPPVLLITQTMISTSTAHAHTFFIFYIYIILVTL